jgi:predicted RecB family nuclease
MKNKLISSSIAISYKTCRRKAYLLLISDKEGTIHEYQNMLENLRCKNRDRQISNLIEQGSIVKQYEEHQPLETGTYVANAKFRVGDLEADCDILQSPHTNHDEHVPIIVTGTNKIHEEQKLELLFVGYVLNEAFKTNIQSGRIIDSEGRNHRIKLSNKTKILLPILNSLREWLISPPVDAPPVTLIKECLYCQFFSSCKDIAEKNDDLSQLDRLNPKQIKRYYEKGIFTLKQLSFQFQPRRSRKRKQREKELYKPELQALAIRTGNILIHDIPKLPQSQIEFFLDMEGIPDIGFHYLIGLLSCDQTNNTYRHFWADAFLDEEMAFRQFLDEVKEYDAPIYHYGSYEVKALRQLAKRYKLDIELVQKRLVNLNSHIFGKIYFPVKSNKLKEIGNFIGAKWTSQNASGLQSLVWRYYWDETRDKIYKDLLIQYNEEDCQATKLLASKIREISETAETQSFIDFIGHPKKISDDTGDEIHTQFQAILKFAHADYNEKKIEFRNNPDSEQKKRGAPIGHPWHRRLVPQAQELLSCEPRKLCPKCSIELIVFENKVSERTFIDLYLTENGYSKKIIKKQGPKGYCPKCHRYHSPENLHGGVAFGHGFQSWIIYDRLSLRLPYESIIESLNEQFGEKISPGLITLTTKRFAKFYAETDSLLFQRILESPFIHADETRINIQGQECYAWVFTDGKHVVLKMTETREATFVVELLKEYKGILVSDFYSAYDSVDCQHQKCLVHLIRDMNDDLWKSPFDIEYQEFILEFKNLVVSIMETVNLYGLSKEHLSIFVIQVDSFYEKTISGKTYQSDVAVKYQKRLKKYRDSLFTFINYDGIPWNNNMAERALRHLVVQENISKTFYKSVFPDHLLLMGIMQTCRFQKKSFLKFLISGEKDVDSYMQQMVKPER